MNISSLNALSSSEICFNKSDRNRKRPNYILAVRENGKEREIVTVSCKELTYLNFLLKFLGLGPLAKLDLHLAEVSKELNRNWQVIQKELVLSSSLTENLQTVESHRNILNNIARVFQKCQQSKKGTVPSNWQSDINPYNCLINCYSKEELSKKIEVFQSIINHQLFSKIGDQPIDLMQFSQQEKYYTDSALFPKILKQFLELPDLFFADPTWIKEFLINADLLQLLKDKPELLSSFKKLPSSLLTPEMIKQLPAMAKAFVGSWDSREAIVENYCKSLSAEKAAAFKLKVGIVQDSFDRQGVENFRFLFTLIAAPKEHFADIRALFAPLIQKLEKEGKETSGYATLISLIIEKPLKEQRSWAEAFITSIGDRPEIKFNQYIGKVRDFSLQEFEGLVKPFEGKACFNTIFSDYFDLFQWGMYPFEALAILAKMDPCFDQDIVFNSILTKWDQVDFKNLQEKQRFIDYCQSIVSFSQEIKTTFPEMEDNHYNLIFERFIKVKTKKNPAEELKRAQQWLKWSNELFEEEAWKLFSNEFLSFTWEAGAVKATLELSSLLFNGTEEIFQDLQQCFAGFMDKSLVERQQDIAPFLDLYRIAYIMRRETLQVDEKRAKAKLAAFGKILAEVRSYRVLKKGSFAFDSEAFLGVVGKTPSLEHLQEILSGNNQEYNLLIQKWQAIEEELSENPDHCRRPKSARSAHL